MMRIVRRVLGWDGFITPYDIVFVLALLALVALSGIAALEPPIVWADDYAYNGLAYCFTFCMLTAMMGGWLHWRWRMRTDVVRPVAWLDMLFDWLGDALKGDK